MSQETLTVERQNVKETHQCHDEDRLELLDLDVEERHCKHCGTTIDSFDTVVVNPTLFYDSLVDTVMSVTWFRLRNQVLNDDVFAKGKYVDCPEKANSDLLYSEKDVKDQISSALSLNTWHNIQSNHNNSPVLGGDYINTTCEDCTDDIEKRFTDDVKENDTIVDEKDEQSEKLEEYGVGFMVAGTMGLIMSYPPIGFLLAIGLFVGLYLGVITIDHN